MSFKGPRGGRLWPSEKKNLEQRRLMLRLLRLTGCELCGERDPDCMDFHHEYGPKEFRVNNACVLRGRRQLLIEIRKCRVLCANCHRKQHA